MREITKGKEQAYIDQVTKLKNDLDSAKHLADQQKRLHDNLMTLLQEFELEVES